MNSESKSSSEDVTDTAENAIARDDIANARAASENEMEQMMNVVRHADPSRVDTPMPALFYDIQLHTYRSVDTPHMMPMSPSDIYDATAAFMAWGARQLLAIGKDTDDIWSTLEVMVSQVMEEVVPEDEEGNEDADSAES